jgi:RNA polymerase sigma-70 factor (ECF subfamily)
MRLMHKKNTKLDFELDYDCIFKRYYTQLVVFACKYVEDRFIAEDIVQDVFIKIWKRADDIIKMEYISSYLYRSVHNTCISYLNNSKKLKKEQISEKILSDEDILNTMLENEIYEEMLNIMEELPPKCKEIYSLNLKGLKTPEIAEDMNIAVDTVRSQIKRAKKIIRDKYSKLYIVLYSNIKIKCSD